MRSLRKSYLPGKKRQLGALLGQIHVRQVYLGQDDNRPGDEPLPQKTGDGLLVPHIGVDDDPPPPEPDVGYWRP